VSSSTTPIPCWLRSSPRASSGRARRLRLLAAHSAGDDIVVEPGGGSVRLPMLRQQTAKPAGRPNRCLADFLAPAADHLGGSPSPSTVPTSWPPSYEAPATRLLLDHGQGAGRPGSPKRSPSTSTCWPGETGTNRTPPRIRTTCWPSVPWYPPGLRPFRGAPTTAPSESCSTCCDAGQFGMTLTESCAMWPAASVSGLLFAHPGARYLPSAGSAGTRPPITPAGKASASAKRKRWLRPNLAYDPQ